MAKTRKAPKKQKPFWERAYNGHALWLGKQKLGKVTLHAGKDAAHRYTWEAAGKAGASNDLDKARAAVESEVALAGRQLPLFD